MIIIELFGNVSCFYDIAEIRLRYQQHNFQSITNNIHITKLSTCLPNNELAKTKQFMGTLSLGWYDFGYFYLEFYPDE